VSGIHRVIGTVRGASGDRLILDFGSLASGLWYTAYDGCNWTGGRFRLQLLGRFSTSAEGTTLRACGPE
jgi:hypothetical protein